MSRPHMLLAYDAAGNVIATLDYVVAKDAEGHAAGLVDFEGHELAGGKHRDTWLVSNATGSGTWPEWLGSRAHEFRVELDGKRIAALVHRESGHRRERAVVEAAIAAVEPHPTTGERDIRRIVGGPGKPLTLNDDGTTSDVKPSGTPAHLPLVGTPTPQGS